MAETSFIKTVAFGGYDKTETENLFEAMNLQICELQNELRQNKLLLDNYKSNPGEKDNRENIDAILSAERTKLSQMQVQNETLAAKNKDLSSELRDTQIEVRKLNTEIDELRKKLEEAETIKSNAEDTQAAAEKLVEEAQKNAESIKESARAEADMLKKNTLDLIETVMNEANENAEKIVKNAEARAAEIDAAIKERYSAASKAAADRRSGVLDNVKKLEDEFAKLRQLIADFEKSGSECVEAGEKLLGETRDTVESIEEQEPELELNVLPAERSGKEPKDLTAFEKFKERLYGDVAKEKGIDVRSAINQGVLYVNPPEPSSQNFLYVNPPESAKTVEPVKVTEPVKVVEPVRVAENIVRVAEPVKAEDQGALVEGHEETAEKAEKVKVVKVRRVSAADREPVAVQPVTAEKEPADKTAAPDDKKAEPAEEKAADKKPAAEEKPKEDTPKQDEPADAPVTEKDEDQSDELDMDMLMAMAEALNED